MLVEHAPDLWTATQPLSMWGLHFGSRMTVVRLQDGGLWLHSPIAPTDEVKEAVSALGEVRCILAPNRYHHLSVGDWKAAFPEAKLCVAPGLETKRKDLAIDAFLSDEPEPEWAEELDQVHVAGNKTFRETVFLHRASKTMISCDLALNMTSSDHAFTRFYLWSAGVKGKLTLSRPLRPTWTFNRGVNRAAADRFLAWDFDRLILAHGAVVEEGARERLTAGFRWL